MGVRRGFGKKVRAWNDRALLGDWRERWAALANERLAELGHDARIDHRSHAEQGIELEPQHKIGPAGARREQRGEDAERAAEHRGDRAAQRRAHHRRADDGAGRDHPAAVDVHAARPGAVRVTGTRRMRRSSTWRWRRWRRRRSWCGSGWTDAGGSGSPRGRCWPPNSAGAAAASIGGRDQHACAAGGEIGRR